jgi:hypothetical protein
MIAAPKISLGMSKSEVVELLQPTQARLKNTDIKQPDMYKKDGIWLKFSISEVAGNVMGLLLMTSSHHICLMMVSW